MAIKDWYKLTFPIESDSEEIIIWKLNELGIFSFSFEYLIKNENKKEVNIWLPIDDWCKSYRSGFEKIISKLLKINAPNNQFFDWSFIKEEDWLTSWKKYWAPELVGNHLLILPCWMNLNEKFKDKKVKDHLHTFVVVAKTWEKSYSFNSSFISFQNQTEIVINIVEIFVITSA